MKNLFSLSRIILILLISACVAEDYPKIETIEPYHHPRDFSYRSYSRTYSLDSVVTYGDGNEILEQIYTSPYNKGHITFENTAWNDKYRLCEMVTDNAMYCEDGYYTFYTGRLNLTPESPLTSSYHITIYEWSSELFAFVYPDEPKKMYYMSIE